MQSNEPDSVSTALAAAIQREIAAAGGWIGFDRYMALALYAPGLGYYANAGRKFGTLPSSGSDFVTAPELSPLFGRCLARQVREALVASGTHEVIEFGAGSGALAETLLDALVGGVDAVAAEADAVGLPQPRNTDRAVADAADTVALGPLRYTIVELSAELQARQRERLARHAGRVRWATAWPERIEGVVVANELLDAMPVQLLHVDGTAWSERGVGVGPDGRFAWVDRTTELRPPVEAAFVPGTTVELHAQAEAWVRGLAERLQAGAAFLIDYGFPEAEYYHPQRTGGTLMCHRAHRADTDPLADVGLKDITAHVNFSGIALAGQEAGLTVAGYTSQARFLFNCGLAELLEGLGPREIAPVQKLVAEHEMGELFKVIAFARDPAYAPLGFAAGDRTHRL